MFTHPAIVVLGFASAIVALAVGIAVGYAIGYAVGRNKDKV